MNTVDYKHERVEMAKIKWKQKTNHKISAQDGKVHNKKKWTEKIMLNWNEKCKQTEENKLFLCTQHTEHKEECTIGHGTIT